ncbi:MAG: hypothetical protein WB661_01395 [Candidatus Bathyarchaeia archaeon]
MSGIPEVDMRIRKLVQAVFRSQGMLREYFTDLFPYMREALRHFNLEKAWETVYTDVVMGDFELDRLSLFLNRLYLEDRQLFASFLGYVTKELFDRFHEPKENLTWFFEELKELGFSWDGKKKTFVPAEP